MNADRLGRVGKGDPVAKEAEPERESRAPPGCRSRPTRRCGSFRRSSAWRCFSKGRRDRTSRRCSRRTARRRRRRARRCAGRSSAVFSSVAVMPCLDIRYLHMPVATGLPLIVPHALTPTHATAMRAQLTLAWRYGRFLGFWLRLADVAAGICACRDVRARGCTAFAARSASAPSCIAARRSGRAWCSGSTVAAPASAWPSGCPASCATR